MTTANEILADIRKGISRSGGVCISYNGQRLKITRVDSSAVDKINEQHMIGVYDGKAPELDILDDISTFIEQYKAEQNKQSERLTKSLGLA